ncbi:hypothetical protein FXO38_30180 [Capsicum annuum]|nr:hypothetical protein FXO38_30180 [Capsicum annuum]
MNRDSGPSFSLEFSQLETIKEYEEVVNFIPGSFDYESVEFDENRSKHRNDPHTMKKLRKKYAKKDKKKEIHGSKKRGSNSSPSKAPAKRRRVVEVIYRDELPKCSYSNIVPIAKELEILDLLPTSFASTHSEELEKLDLPPTNFVSNHSGTSPVSSSIENPDQRSYKVILPQISTDHDSFEDFSTTPPSFLMRGLINISGLVSAPLLKSGKNVPVERR